jgi:hypothetical protein
MLIFGLAAAGDKERIDYIITFPGNLKSINKLRKESLCVEEA